MGITGTHSGVTSCQPQQGLLPSITDSKAAWCFINAIWCCLLARKLSLFPSRNFVPERGDFSLEQVGIDISGPCTHQSNSLHVNTAKNGGTWKKAKDKVTLWSSCNAQKWKVTALRSCNLSSEIHEDRHLSSCHALPLLADRRNKTLECRLATLDASSGTMSHEQCFLGMYRSLYTRSQMPPHACTPEFSQITGEPPPGSLLDGHVPCTW